MVREFREFREFRDVREFREFGEFGEFKESSLISLVSLNSLNSLISLSHRLYVMLSNAKHLLAGNTLSAVIARRSRGNFSLSMSS